jgi:hypothetical protein
MRSKVNPNYSYGGISKLKALHNAFKPEYEEEDELLPILAGTAQKQPDEVESQHIPSVYDNPNSDSFSKQTRQHFSNVVGKGLSALKDYLSESFKQNPEKDLIVQPEGQYLHAGSMPKSTEMHERPSVSKVKNFLGRSEENNKPNQSMISKSEPVKQATMTPQQVKFYDNSPAAQKSMSPEMKARYVEAKNQEVKSTEEKIAEVEKNKKETLVPGASEELLKDPMASAQFKKVTGIDYTPELKEALKPYEALAKQAQDSLTEEEVEIRKRFDSGSMTTQDKILLGLAIAIPSILAGVFGGAEAGASAIAGGLKGVSDVLNNQQTKSIADIKRLGEIGKEKLNIEASTADLNKKLKELVPGDPIKEALEGKQTVYIPETGKTGIKVGNDGLYYDMDNLSKGDIKNDLTDMRALAKDGRERMEAINSLYDVTNDLDKVYDQLIKKGSNSFFPSVIGKTIPGGENWLSADVVDPKTGSTMKASVLIGQLVEKGLDKYRTSQVGGSRAITEAMRAHFDQLLGNPFKLSQALSIKDAKNMANTFQTIAAKEFIDGMETEGFLRQPLEKKFLIPIEEKKRGVARDVENQKLQKEAEQEIKKMTPEQLKQARQGYVVETSNG